MRPEGRRDDEGRREGKKRDIKEGERIKKMKSPARYHLDLRGKNGR